MDDILQKYLKDKYGENYDQKAQEEYDSARDQNKWANLGANIGESFAAVANKGRVGDSDAYFQNLNKQAKENTLGKIEADRNQFVKNMTDSAQIADLSEKERIRKEESDPMNPMVENYRKQMAKFGVQIPEGMTVADIKRNYGDAKTLNEIQMRSAIDYENQKKLRQMDEGARAREKEKDRAFELEKEKTKFALEQSKKTDPKNLTGSDKQRFDNIKMTLNAINEMGTALDAGQNTRTFSGDNDFTLASRNASEAIGRMQSGGAIGKEEEARFLAMLPGPFDSKVMQRKKLIDLRKEMNSRLETLGFTPEQAKIENKEFKYGSGEEKEKDVEAYAKNNNISYEDALEIKKKRESQVAGKL